jgi:hypothetical protein
LIGAQVERGDALRGVGAGALNGRKQQDDSGNRDNAKGRPPSRPSVAAKAVTQGDRLRRLL